MGGVPTSDNVKSDKAARMLSLIIQDEIGGIAIPAELITQLIFNRWQEISLYAHAIHNQRYERKPDEVPDNFRDPDLTRSRRVR